MIQNIYNDLGRTEDLIAEAVAAMRNFKNDLIGLVRIMPRTNRLVTVRIERQADVLDGLNTVAAEQLSQLLQRYSHTLMKGCRSRRVLGSQSELEIVEHRQQVADEGFFFRRSGQSGVPPGAFLEIFEVGGEPQIMILLFSQLLTENDRIICRCGLVRIVCRVWKIGLHVLPFIDILRHPFSRS